MDLMPIYVALGYLAGGAITFLGYIYYIRETNKGYKWSYYNQQELEGEVGWTIFFTLFWPLVWVTIPFSIALFGLVKLAKYLLERE